LFVIVMRTVADVPAMTVGGSTSAVMAIDLMTSRITLSDARGSTHAGS